jgi:hypothetical protein
MTFTTKYGIGDKVWTVWAVPFKAAPGKLRREFDLEAFHVKIVSVEVWGSEKTVQYHIEPPEGSLQRSRVGRMLVPVVEDLCFATKEEARTGCTW